MKTKSILLSIILTAMMTSCVKDSSVFRLETEPFNGAKVHIDDEYFACWDDEDVIQVNGREYTVEVDAHSASISNVLTAKGYYAVYPAEIVSAGGFRGATYDICLPAVQYYGDNPDRQKVVAPMVAAVKQGGGTLSFHNLTALISINVTNDLPEPFTVRTVTVSAPSDKILGGYGHIYDMEGVPYINYDPGETFSSVALYCGKNGVTLAPGETRPFYVSIPEVARVKLTVTVSDGNKGLSRSRSSQATYLRNNIYGVPFKLSGSDEKVYTSNRFHYTTVTGEPMGLDYRGPDNAYLTDPSWGAVLISDDYQDGVGELWFDNDITSIADMAFLQHDELATIEFPANLKRIGAGAFQSCENLARVSIPATITSVGDYAFRECYSLMEVYCYASRPPSSGTDIFYNVGWGCVLHVPRGRANVYNSNDEWSSYYNFWDVIADL